MMSKFTTKNSTGKPVKKNTRRKGSRGRPTKYFSEYAEEAKKLCLVGYTDAQLSDYFEISESTLNLWKKKHPEFSESIKFGKNYADAKVAFGLYQRAVGMVVPDCHIHTRVVENGKKEELLVTTTPFARHIAPDTNAARFWLKNRQKDLWKEVSRHKNKEGGVFGIVINEFLQ